MQLPKNLLEILTEEDEQIHQLMEGITMIDAKKYSSVMNQTLSMIDAKRRIKLQTSDMTQHQSTSNGDEIKAKGGNEKGVKARITGT